MAEPLLSIVTTSYNRAQYLGSTIESVLAQDYADFEYLVVDDCSPDGSLAVARSYMSDSRLRVIGNDRNLGDYGNRNKGLRLARGKYVKFVDCDDVLYPHCVGTMLETAEMYPDAGVVFATRERPPWRYPIELSPEQVYRLHFSEGGVLHQGALSSLLRREAVLAAGGFPEIYTGDVACWLNLAREYPVVLMSGGMYWWREHVGQLSESLRSVSVKWAAHQAEGTGLHWEALAHPGCPLPAVERVRFQKRIERDYLRLIIRNSLCGRLRVVRELQRNCPFRATAGAYLRAPSRSAAGWSAPRTELMGASRPLQPAMRKWSNCERVACISVLLPIANDGPVLRDTIESILSQDHDDWELIMVDDASIDGSAGIAAEYADGKRVRLIRNAIQAGKWAAHNQCAKLAQGRYLKFMGAGDTLARSALRDFAWYAARFPRAGLIISCSDDRFLMPQKLAPEELYQTEAMGLLSALERPSGALYERLAWCRAGGFDPGCQEAAGKLHLKIGRETEVVFIPGGLVSYACGSAALRISRTRGAGRSDGESKVLQDAIHAADCPLSESDRQVALSGLARCASRVKWERRCGGFAPVRRMIRMLFPDPPAFTVATKLWGEQASFDRSNYP